MVTAYRAMVRSKVTRKTLSFYDDAVLINQLRHAVRSKGKMSEQRVPYSVREEARMGLTDWWADRMDTAFMNQLGGNSNQTDTKFTGNNTAQSHRRPRTRF